MKFKVLLVVVIMSGALIAQTSQNTTEDIVLFSSVRYKASRFRFTYDEVRSAQEIFNEAKNKKEKETASLNVLKDAIEEFGRKFSQRSDLSTRFSNRITTTIETGVNAAGMPSGSASAKDETSLEVETRNALSIANDFKEQLTEEERKTFEEMQESSRQVTASRAIKAASGDFHLRFLLVLENMTDEVFSFDPTNGNFDITLFINDDNPFTVSHQKAFSVFGHSVNNIVIDGPIKDKEVSQKLRSLWSNPEVDFDGIFRLEIGAQTSHLLSGDGKPGITYPNCAKTTYMWRPDGKESMARYFPVFIRNRRAIGDRSRVSIREGLVAVSKFLCKNYEDAPNAFFKIGDKSLDSINDVPFGRVVRKDDDSDSVITVVRINGIEYCDLSQEMLDAAPAKASGDSKVEFVQYRVSAIANGETRVNACTYKRVIENLQKKCDRTNDESEALARLLWNDKQYVEATKILSSLQDSEKLLWPDALLLCYAIKSGDEDFVKRLLSVPRYGKAAINTQMEFEGEHFTPLRVAIKYDRLTIFKELVERRAGTVFPFDRRHSSLVDACFFGSSNIVKVIVEHAPDAVSTVNVLDGEPLKTAARTGNRWLCRYLIDHGADVSRDNVSEVARQNGF